MKLIVWKELRENLKWAALGMVVFSIGLIYAWSKITDPNYSYSEESHQSICGPIFLMTTTIGSAVLGAAMGLLQILTELKSRDQWAFLVHRPIHRKTIFRGKAIAGIILYLLATLFPFTAMVWWASLPEKLGAPFDWGMSLAGYADILTGICYYFAGLLAGIRQAHWLGTKTLGLATAIYCSFLVTYSYEFWQAAAWMGLFAIILAAAAEGSFQTTGTYRLQNKIGKFALGIVLFLGILKIESLLIHFIEILTQGRNYGTWSQYNILKDGTVVVDKSDESGPTSIFTLDGKPMNYSKEKLSRFYQETLRLAQLRVSEDRFYMENSYRSSNRFFLVIRFDEDSKQWFYVFKKGEFWGYDPLTKKSTGVIGSNGFSRGGEVKPFNGRLIRQQWDDEKVFRFSNSVYWIDNFQEEVVPIHSSDKTQEIAGACEIGKSYDHDEENVHAVALATPHRVQFYSTKGQLIFETPYHYKPPYLDSISSAVTPKGDGYFLWYQPGWDEEGDEDRSKWPSYLVELSNTGQVIKQLVLPAFPEPEWQKRWLDYFNEWSPPLGTTLWGDVKTLAQYEYGDKNARKSLKWMKKNWKWCLKLILIQAGVGFLCAIPTFLRSRKYSFEVRHPWIWSLIVFLGGIFGLLTFLCIREWPAMETCASCEKKRLVTSELCEHCSATFPPPRPDGTEIFEP